MIIIISITIVTHLDCLLRSSTLQGGGREPGNESAQPALGNDTSNTHARAQTFTRARDNWIERANFEVQRSSNRQDCWWLFFANHFLINWISDRKWRPVSETSHLNKEVFLGRFVHGRVSKYVPAMVYACLFIWHCTYQRWVTHICK